VYPIGANSPWTWTPSSLILKLGGHDWTGNYSDVLKREAIAKVTEWDDPVAKVSQRWA